MREQFAQPNQRMANLTEVFVQGAARMFELQTAAAQALLRAQARNVAMLGGPDLSRILDANTEQLSIYIRTTTEQGLTLVRQANDTLQEVQNQLGELAERQAREVSASARVAIAEMTRSVDEELAQTRSTAEQLIRETEIGIEEAGQRLRDAAAVAGDKAEEARSVVATEQRPGEPRVPGKPVPEARPRGTETRAPETTRTAESRGGGNGGQELRR